MIHKIARQCTKPLAFLSDSKVQNIKNFANLTLCYFHNGNQYRFSTQAQKKSKRQVQKEILSPIDYYRNTIRRVNIKANGRGKFSAFNLQKIVNMSMNEEHAKVMFEAYFNYMGHFTLIPSKVVDSLVLKAIQIGNQTQQVLEIFSHHCYLGYFPHYDATNRFIKSLANAKDFQNLNKVLRIMIRSPLLKINHKIVDNLLQVASGQDCEPTTREYVLKVLIYRRNLTDGINKQDLLSKISAVLQKSEFGPFQAKRMILDQLKELFSEQSSSTQETVNRLILTSTFGLIDDCGSILAKQTQEIGSQYERFFGYATKLYPRSSKEVNYGKALKEALVEAKLSLQVSEKLEKLANGQAE